MGYACVICDECLEVPAPEYLTTGNPNEAFGSEEAAFIAASPPTQKAFVKKPTKSKNLAKNIRDGVSTDVTVTQCGHLFHQTCIARWSKGKNSMNCPVCMKLCLKSKLNRIFPEIVNYHPDLDDDFISPKKGQEKNLTSIPGPSSGNKVNGSDVQDEGVQFVIGPPHEENSRQVDGTKDRDTRTVQSGEKRPSGSETGDDGSPRKRPRNLGNDDNSPDGGSRCVIV